MQVEVEVMVDAPKADVWRVMTDIENAATTISGIEEVEVLEKPSEGLLGLKWRETRTMFGKTAVETMWVTAVEEGSHYDVEARSHGSIYRSRISLADSDEGTHLRMAFDAEAQSLLAKVLAPLMSLMAKGATRKALQKDLEDVKAAVESGATA